MSLFITIPLFLLILLILVLVHEFGHFIVAKRCRVRVDEFGIGFPPKIWGKKFGETEYTLNALPFGGFVKIYGEDSTEKSEDPKDKGRKFDDIPLWKQALVMVAGVVMNFILAWVLLSSTFLIGITGTPETTPEGVVLEDQALTIVRVLSESPASGAGLKPGDELLAVSVSEEKISTPTGDEFRTFTATHKNQEIAVRYARDEKVSMVTLSPQTGVTEKTEDRAIIGVSTLMIGTYSLPPHLALWEGLKQTLDFTQKTIIGLGAFFGKAFMGQADLDQIAGPVGIVNLVGKAVGIGIVTLLQFVAIISISLAVINIIPFPALDGGRLMLLVIEAVKGSPIKPGIVGTINGVGFAVLILLMVLVTYNDIIRIMSS